ncbi:MAG: hypothetical protein WC680_11250 [Sulfuricurvum sp.]
MAFKIRLLAKLQEVVCLKEASFSDPSGLSVVKWTLKKHRFASDSLVLFILRFN